jgi:hypothetical protein
MLTTDDKEESKYANSLIIDSSSRSTLLGSLGNINILAYNMNVMFQKEKEKNNVSCHESPL